ncbi:MAG: ribonuclease D [Coriobacteriia bacterium]|nr:ribonuclease D [Coriobacteriia bacterium]
MYIDTQQALLGFIERAQNSPVLAIDTEFLREKTYYAKLCLLQMATEDEVAIVDPFAVSDLGVLADLFMDAKVTKLFHAASQDLEILYREVGVMPFPVFDTQVAAALMGHTQQIGYASLVSAECGVQLKKADSFTDWSRRPLAPSQVRYAADDVIYLPKLYAKMTKQLKDAGRLHWLDEDFAELANPDRYLSDPRERFRRLKRVNCLNRKQMAAAREVAAWREERAQMRNVPRKWIMTDEQLVEACRREAHSIDELFMVRGMRDRLSTKDARTVADIMSKALSLPPSDWPELAKSSRNERNVDAELDLMLALVRKRAQEQGIAMQTLASHDDLTALARGHRRGLALMKGWRRELIGNELVQLLEGRLCLYLGEEGLVVKPWVGR